MLKIVDTTLRDGEQRAGVAFGLEEKIEIARMLDRIGIYQIEAGTPAMGGDEKKSIQRICELGLKSKISAWNRLNPDDVKHSMECGVEIIHVSAPASEIHINTKLKKDRQWVIDRLKKCISIGVEKDFIMTVGFEDASRADSEFLSQLVEASFKEGAQRIRYADTVGIMHRQRLKEDLDYIRKRYPIDVEIHAHNDLGMAVANSLQGVISGASYVNCTIGGIGERAGNCNYAEFVKSAKGCLGIKINSELETIEEVEKLILEKVYFH